MKCVLCQVGTTTNSNREDDEKWPKRNKDGLQELEILLGNEHIAFNVSQPSIFRIRSHFVFVLEGIVCVQC